MYRTTPETSINTTRVLIIANYELVRRSLNVLIESHKSLEVAGLRTLDDDFTRPNAISEAHVAIVYLSAGERIEVITDLLNTEPELRIVALVSRDDMESQVQAVSLGAVGIVHKEQNTKMLIEAIRQTRSGETWLNQTLLNKILVKGKKPAASNGVSEPKCQKLTPRELDVVRMIGEGLKNKEIADRLDITEATVRHHLSSIYGKVGVDDRLNLVILAHQTGLIELGPNGSTSYSMKR